MMMKPMDQGYQLIFDGTPGRIFPDLNAAQAAGRRLYAPGHRIRIESLVAPAASRAWDYDPKADEWIEDRSAPFGGVK
jgi:hypothetical protein